MKREYGIQGLEELNKLLETLPQKAQYNVLRASLFAGAKAIEKEAKLRAPRLTGRLAKSIKAKRSKSKKRSEVASRVEVQVPYGHLAEYGFNHTSGRHVPGKPFLFPAFKGREKEIQADIVKKLRTAILKELSGPKWISQMRKAVAQAGK